MPDLERWSDIRKLLERPGKITGAGFEPDPAILEFLQNDARVLVVGAGASHSTPGVQAKQCWRPSMPDLDAGCIPTLTGFHRSVCHNWDRATVLQVASAVSC